GGGGGGGGGDARAGGGAEIPGPRPGRRPPCWPGGGPSPIRTGAAARSRPSPPARPARLPSGGCDLPLSRRSGNGSANCPVSGQRADWFALGRRTARSAWARRLGLEGSEQGGGELLAHPVAEVAPTPAPLEHELLVH